MAEDFISRKALLDAIDGIYDCADMVFEPNDHCCKSEDCAGCKWVKTKNYIRKMVANAPSVKLNIFKEDKIMLNIGQAVFVVCKLFTNGDKYKIYVSRKEINRVERNQEGVIVYTAGKHNELRFYETEDGSYRAFGARQKAVYLTKEAAEMERKARLEEKEEVK